MAAENPSSEDEAVKDHGVLYRLYRGNFTKELKSTLSLASGLMVTNFSAMILATMPTLFLGHVGQSELSAAALINVAFSVVCEPVILGLSSACDTYFAQAYGSGEKLYVGVLLQRGFAIIFLACIVIAAVFINAGNALVLIRMDPEIARMTEEYLTIFTPGIFGFAANVILTKYMAVQNHVLPSVIIALLGILICSLVNFVLVLQLNMGVVGAALGQNCAYFAMALASVGYICITTKLHKATWPGWTSEMLLDWGPFFLLGLKGTMLFCVEYWIWVIMVLAAGYLGEVELGTQEVLFNIEVIFVTLGLGVGDATAIRVGQELGAGNVEMVTVAARVSYTFVGVVASVLSITLGALRYVVPMLYTNIPPVLHMAGEFMPLIAFMIFADNLSYTGIGVFRGGGYQGYGFLIIAAAYYLVALPVSLSLMFLTDLRTYGAWIGTSIGISIASVMFFVASHFIIDWNKAALKAKERIMGSSNGTNGAPLQRTFKESSALLSGDQLNSCSVNEDQNGSDRMKSKLLRKRMLTCACVFLFLIASIIIRICVPHSRSDSTQSNSTVDFDEITTWTTTSTIRSENGF